jgi:hypothetical protein
MVEADTAVVEVAASMAAVGAAASMAVVGVASWVVGAAADIMVAEGTAGDITVAEGTPAETKEGADIAAVELMPLDPREGTHIVLRAGMRTVPAITLDSGVAVHPARRPSIDPLLPLQTANGIRSADNPAAQRQQEQEVTLRMALPKKARAIR